MVHCDLREGRTALQDRAEGYRVLKHQMRPGELDHAILTGADLTGAQLGGLAGMAADFRDAVMVGVTLSGAKMKNARLDGADLSNSDLSGTDFSGASLRGAVVVGANLSAASLKDADLEGLLKAPPPVVFIDDRPLADLIRDHQLWCQTGGLDGAFFRGEEVDFRAAGDLRGVSLTALSAQRAVFYGMDLTGAELQGADLTGADLRGVRLCGADLRGAKLRDARLTRADLTDAKLGPLEVGPGRIVRADLTRACLRQARLCGADLTQARLLRAELEGVRTEGAILTLAEFDEGGLAA
jgi:uncharacterized protein YjbI with pentapeptide repeats